MSKITVYPGVYFDDEKRRYSYRPTVNGQRSERRLKARTEAEAIKEFLKIDNQQEVDQTVADLAKLYLDAGAPNKSAEPRAQEFVDMERCRLDQVLPYWGKYLVKEMNLSACLKYRDWRVGRVRDGFDGLRTVDMELTTLANVVSYAVMSGKADSNPIASRPKFRTKVSHCREHCPRSGDELHTLANKLMSGFTDSQTLAWQMVFEACSGCRTGEALALRWDAAIGEPGHIRDGKYLCIKRSKQREDNDPYDYIVINPALQLVLEAMKNWNHHPDSGGQSVWFFPAAGKDTTVNKGALAHALLRIRAKLLPGRRITSHGMRAFYVTWQRTSGTPMLQIADDLGHVSGSGLIFTTYGRRPQPWATAACTPFPKTVTPVWEPWLKQDEKIVNLKTATV